MSESQRIAPELHKRILSLFGQNIPKREIGRILDMPESTIRGVIARETPRVESNKKVGELHWREAVSCAKQMQGLKRKLSSSQDYANIKLGDGTRPVILCAFGDQHIGAGGCNYAKFEELTDEILSTPDLYLALLGDFSEMAIKMRNVLEVTSQILTPDMQDAFLESWLKDVKERVAFAVWGNHEVMRQEAQAGTSSTKNILSRNVVYHNGIGHQEIQVGKQVYKCAASHLFRGGSMFNRMHAQGRYVRQEAADRELVLSGHTHTFGFSYTEDGGQERLYVSSGTLLENSGYGKRFFSLKSAPHFPCVVLMHDKHEMVPFLTIGNALRFVESYQ